MEFYLELKTGEETRKFQGKAKRSNSGKPRLRVESERLKHLK